MAGLSAVIVILWLLLRNKNGATSTSPVVWALLVKFAALIVAAAILANANALIAMPVTLLLFVNWQPSLILERIVIPLGWYRLAYWIVLLCWPFDQARAIRAGATLYGALAIKRRGPNPHALHWLETHLRALPANDGTSGVAAALLAEMSGNQVLARSLMQHADKQTTHTISHKAKAVAQTWLVDDAAQSGNWREVIAIAARNPRSPRWSRLVTQLAEMLLEKNPAKNPQVLWLQWFAAPRRLSTLPLLRRVLDMAQGKVAHAAATDNPEPENLAQALAGLLCSLENLQEMTAPNFIDAIRRVESQLDHPETTRHIVLRLQALGAPPEPAPVLQRFRGRLIDIITPLIEAAPHLVHDASEVFCITEAKAQARRKLFSDIEVRCRDYNARTDSSTTMSNIDEWNSWTALCDIAERLLQIDSTAEESLFQATYHDICNFAVYLHNKRDNKVLAHDMFCWLHSHCKADVSAAALLARNMGIR